MIKKFLLILLFLLITTTANALTASWSLNPQEEQVTNYTLYYKKELTTEEKKVNSSTNGVSIEDSGFEIGTTFIFTLTATNSNGEGPRCAEVKYTFEDDPLPEDDVPETPYGIKITIDRPVIVE